MAGAGAGVGAGAGSRIKGLTCKVSSSVGRAPEGTSLLLGPIRGLVVADLVLGEASAMKKFRLGNR